MMQGVGLQERSSTAAGAEVAPLLQAKGIVKNFGAVQVLCGVSFDAAAGQVTALLGDNGEIGRAHV